MVVSLGVLIKRVRAVDPQQRWNGGGPDVEDPGVRYFTVNLHHHLVLVFPDDAVCNGKKRKMTVVSSGFINNRSASNNYIHCRSVCGLFS